MSSTFNMINPIKKSSKENPIAIERSFSLWVTENIPERKVSATKNEKRNSQNTPMCAIG